MQIAIKTEEDIVVSRSAAKEMAKEIGFGIVDQTKIMTAISEIIRNVIKYADEGVLQIRIVREGDKQGIEIDCADSGPGIDDIDQALEDGYSTSGSLGMGLPGSKRLMDDFTIESHKGQGTHVVARKWL